VRGIERLGEILVELRHAPDPRVLVEVALVQLTTQPAAAADDVVALAARVSKLEQARAAGAPAAAPAPGAPRDPATGRAQLGGRARRAAATARDADHPVVGRDPERTAAVPPAPSVAAAIPRSADPVSGASSGDAEGGEGDVAGEWEHQVRPVLKGIVRALYTPVDVLAGSASTITMAAPNATHRDKCAQHRAAVEDAWRQATGRSVSIELVIGGAPADDTGPHRAPDAAPSPPAAPADEDVDLDDLVDAAPGSVPSAIERLAEAFPGAELIERSEPR
jgi:DNA polymerase-3 subunit gamma/tau